MKKTNDFFFAGLFAGAIGGVCLNLYVYVLVLLGVPTGTYWKAMGGLFYNAELLQTWLAQIHGLIDSIGVSAANGVLFCYVLVVTGRDYLYTKSLALSAAGAYFLFLVVYPHTGLGKDNPYTPWVALFGHTVFNGLLVGYILKKIYSFREKPKTHIETDGSIRLRRFYQLTEREEKERNSVGGLRKPKKIL